jgi:hypothetical protein
MSTTELRRLKDELDNIEKAYDASELTLADYREKRDAVKAAAWAEAQKIEDEYYQRLAKRQAAEDLEWKEYHAKMAAAEKAAQEAKKLQQQSNEKRIAEMSPQDQADEMRREQEEIEAENAWLGDSMRNE